MEKLVTIQRDLQSRIMHAQETIENLEATKVTMGLVRSAVSVMDVRWRKFEANHEKLITDFGDALAGSAYLADDVAGSTEASYLQQRARLLDVEQALLQAAEGTKGEPTELKSPPSRNVLPRIQLPQFSGKFEDWPAFRDLFSSLVSGESSLSKVEKIHYLKTSVKGDAEQLIKNLPTTGDNFERAWATLSDHFENKRLLVRSYLAAFTALPKMKPDSVSDLRRIFHGVVSTVGSLEGIGRPISDCSDLFVHLIVELLDSKTRREWEGSLGKSSRPSTYDELRAFLQEQLMTQEAIRTTAGESSGKSSEKPGRSARSNHVKGRAADSCRNCPLCKKDHFLAFCEQYKKKSAPERREAVTTHQRCWNCLGRHMVSDCPSSKNCSKCSGRHHSSLHEAFATSSPLAVEGSPSPTVHVAERPPAELSSVLLATARVRVTDRAGECHVVRALVDPGSETCLVAESLAQRLRLPRTPTSVAIFGVGGIQTGFSRGRISVALSSRAGRFSCNISALVLPRLSMYNGCADGSSCSWSHVQGLELADPEYFRRDPVELLLGADAYADIALPDLRRGGPMEPIAQHTRLGWILLGPAGASSHAASVVTSLQCSTMDELPAIVRRFWEWEELPGSALPLTSEERECEEHFSRTHERLSDGRYSVRLPLRGELPDLTATRRAAARMLDTMVRRFERDPALRDLYRTFMSDYHTLGHMSPVDAAPADRSCYLPHHGVLRGAGATSKIRVVFNGSSRTSAGVALNDFLHSGPNLLPVLADVLLRWRGHRYVFTADVEKMFRQIQVHPADRDAQRILWTEDNDVRTFQLNTVTYGLACAPYLAIRVLRQLADDETHRFPLGSAVLQRDVYMDDILTGAADLESARLLQSQVSDLCMAGGFPLRKWAANHQAILANVPLEHQLRPATDAALPNDACSVLGLRWTPTCDDFSLVVSRPTRAPPTKRVVLSQTARLFDPLGWLAPIVVRAKLLIQSTWLQQLEWDAPLSPGDAAAWTRFAGELPTLEKIRIPRWYRCGTAPHHVEIHGFADASEGAYAAVVYFRTTYDGAPYLSLVQAKTKVAPLKRVSLPRLELCAAALLAKMVAHIRTTLDLTASPTFLWTDSTVVLAWIQGHPARWTTFVANRVAEIQRASEQAKWRHVPGRENPADCASRGVSPSELLGHPLWWTGPGFLSQGSSSWPAAPVSGDLPDLPEQRPVRCLAAENAREPGELTRFSSLRRLQRVSAWMWRWRRRPLQRPPTSPSVLDPEELSEALKKWLLLIQSLTFTGEREDVSAGRPVSRRSPLRQLTPMLDNQGILRVGGRLKHALLSSEQRHPIILPSESHLTYLIIDDSHRRTLHGGTQATLTYLRQRFWLPRGRQLVRKYIHQCLPCVRWRAASPQPLMGNLPRARITPSRPFSHTGVDFAGPIWLRTTKGRGHKAYKAFLCVFVCFSSRAVHLEVVSDYSADAFLAAFRRFVSRRGLCQVVYSDRGTNFVGADTQLKALFDQTSRDHHRIIGRLADDGVQWRFNPPAAPHFGGLWEAAVRVLKHHLRRVVGETRLTFEEMATFLAETEACLNSRPLQALTDDPEDLDALTPGHFLIGAPLSAVPEPTLVDVPENRLSRWRLLQQMRDHFWGRWSREYLQTISPRPKWWSISGNLREGQLCLLKGEATPPCRWPLARIVRLHPGGDGHVRVVDVRTPAGELSRPVVKLVPLPAADTTGSEPLS